MSSHSDSLSNNPLIRLTAYELKHVLAHIEYSGRIKDLYQLLEVETIDHRNAWFDIKDSMQETGEYLSDLNRSWSIAERINMEEVDLEMRSLAFGWECLCALCIASINSQATSISPSLLKSLVDHKVWTSTQALAYARQIPKSSDRANALDQLRPFLDQDKSLAILPEALSVEELEDRMRILGYLMPYLPEPIRDKALQDALVPIRAEEYLPRKIEILTNLFPYISDPLRSEILSETLKAARALKDEEDRQYCMKDLAEQCAKLGYIQKAFEVANEITWTGELERAQFVAWLVPYLDKIQLHDTLLLARKLKEGRDQVEVLAALIPRLSKPLRDDVLQEALKIARSIKDNLQRALALTELAPHVSHSSQLQILREALQAAESLKYYQGVDYTLAEISLQLGKLGFGEEALEAADYTDFFPSYNSHRRDVPLKIIPYLSESLRNKAIERVLADGRRAALTRERVGTLSDLIPHLIEPLRSNIQHEALAAARAEQSSKDRISVLTALAPCLPATLCQEVLHEALEASKRISDRDVQAQTLAVLASYVVGPLKDHILVDALAAARSIESTYDRVLALVALSSCVPEQLRHDVLSDVLVTIKKIESPGDRATAIVRLAEHLSGLHWKEALTIVQEIGEDYQNQIKQIQSWTPMHGEYESELEDDAYRAQRDTERAWTKTQTYAFSALAAYLPETWLQDALSIGLKIQYQAAQICAVSALIPYLPNALQNEVLHDTLVKAQEVRDHDDRTEALTHLAPYLTQHQLGLVLNDAWKIEDDQIKMKSLVRLIPYLTGRIRNKVMRRAVDGLLHDLILDDDIETFTGLAPYLPKRLLLKARAAARRIENKSDQGDILRGLVPYVPEYLRNDVLREALTAIRAEDYKVHRELSLTRLAPYLAKYLPQVMLNDLWCETLHTSASRTRNELLIDIKCLAPVLLALGGQEAILKTFRTVQNVGQWWP